MGIQERLKRLVNGPPVAGTMPHPVNFNPPTVRDAIGRVLELGDEVLTHQPTMHLRVAQIKRVLHPGAPPNTVELTLVARVQVAVPNNMRLEGMYFLRHAAEIADGFLQNIGAEPPTAEAHPEAPPASTLHLTDKD